MPRSKKVTPVAEAPNTDLRAATLFIPADFNFAALSGVEDSPLWREIVRAMMEPLRTIV